MRTYSHTATYLDAQKNAELKALAKARGCSVSQLLKQLIERELEHGIRPNTGRICVEHALEHIAIGVDALLKYGPGEQGLAAAKETRQRRLKGSGDAR